MAHYSDFTFGNLSRIGTDNCSLDQRTVQDSLMCSYLLQNYFLQDGCMTKSIAFATSQPFVNYSGTHSMGVNGCNVDDSSKLLIGAIQTNPKARIDLNHRIFATVPYLGRGSVDPALEYQIQHGEAITGKKTVTKLTEKNLMKYQTTPLIQEVKQNIQNPNKMIESDAASYWIRGGVPSRELTRDKDFFKNK
jgi:hypothetical protein